MEYENAVFHLLEKYFEKNDVASLQKRSFDHFITHRLPRIIDEEKEIEIPLKKNEFFRVNFGQAFVDRPYIVDEKRIVQHILPSEAMLRDLTYSSVMSVNISTVHFTRNDDGAMQVLEEKMHTKVAIARIPMMVGCCKCNLNQLSPAEREQAGHCVNDPGGYFLIKGKERVLVAQERANYNTVYVFEKKNSDQKHVMVSEIRSMSDETGHSVLIQMKLCSSMRTMVNVPFISQEIPLGYILVAYGCSMDTIHEVMSRSLPMDQDHSQLILHNILKDAMIIQNEENAVNHIAQFATHVVSKERRQAYVKQILMNEVLPHLGISSDETQKILFFGYMCGKMVMTYVGLRPMDDRDHLSNKRIEVSGVLVGDLFRTLWKRFIRTIIPQLMKRLDILTIISKVNVITMGLRHCFSTGNWGIPKSNYIRTGVSQVLSRLSYNSTLSHLRRIVIPIGKEGRNTKIRQVHPTQIGFMCPSETPEGSTAGIVKNFSLIAEVSIYFDPVYIRLMIESIPGLETDFKKFFLYKTWFRIFINGSWIGIVEDGSSAYDYIMDLKNNHRTIPSHTSVFLDEHEIRIYCDEGRMIRPLFVAGNMPTLEDLQKKDWDALMKEGKIVWMDPHELEDKVIAMFPKEIEEGITDLCEIHPCLILGICASLMPFADHTQSPRICYHASMVKQSIGIYCSNNEVRADTVAHILSYPERPIVRSHAEKWLGLSNLPCGDNVIVAIACYGGWNQEDSIILNKSSVDKGLFRSFSYRTIMVEEKKKTSSQIEQIDIPDTDIRIRSYNYSKLDKNGIIVPGIFVGSGDVIVAKTSTHQIKIGREEKMDTSVIIKNGEEGYVDKVFVSTTPDGYKMVKIKIRSLKVPEIGDKLCSNCAQKGTIGMTLDKEDMPFTPDGIVPDIIINPLCFTSGTMVAFQDGLSRRMGDILKEYIQEPLWSFEEDKLVFTPSMGGEFKKKAHVVVMTRADGVKVECTPDHEFLVFDPETKQVVWKECQMIRLGIDHVVVGLDATEDVSHPDELAWKHELGGSMFSTLRHQDRIQSMALYRMAGFYFSLLFHPRWKWDVLDKNMLCHDLIQLPKQFTCQMVRDLDLYHTLSYCPLAIQREFVASFLALYACIQDNQLTMTWDEPSVKEVTIISRISFMLLKNWGVRSSVVDTKKILTLRIRDVITFQKHVGLRYVPWKSLQLSVLVSYLRRKHKVDLAFQDFLEISHCADWFHEEPKSTGLPFWTCSIVSRKRKPEPEDTFCIGASKSHCFLAEGMVVKNCIPSRMTINQLMESIGAKSAVLQGKFRHATTFSHYSTDVVESLKQELHESGYERNGNEVMINGMTGEKLDAEIFIGPCYYHRLKHLVSAKMHARNHGKVSQLTRQPLEGRSREGGLRAGEMERDAIISAGCSRFLLERLFDMSDPFKIPVCAKCGSMPSSLTFCQVCEETDIQHVPLPYACKLLFQELNAMGIRINVFPKKE